MTLVDFEADIVATPGLKAHWGLEDKVFTRQTEDHEQSDEADKLDAAAWGSGYENNLPGLRKAMAKISGIHSGLPGQVGDVLRPLIGRVPPVRAWAARESLVEKSPIEFQPCRVTKYTPKSTKKDVSKYDAELEAAGGFHNGFILVSPKGNTQMITTGSGVDLDNTPRGGATTYGGAAHLVIYDLSGGTTPTITVIIEHSPDGTTWTTLCSFTIATLATKDTTFVQRVKIPSVIAINAHVHASWTTSTSANAPTSVQAMVMFARGIDPDK